MKPLLPQAGMEHRDQEEAGAVGGELIPATFHHLLEHIQRWGVYHSPGLPLPGEFSSSDFYFCLPCSAYSICSWVVLHAVLLPLQAGSCQPLLATPRPLSLSQGGFQVPM